MKNVNEKIRELKIQQSDRLKEKLDEDSQEYVKILEQAGYVLLSEPDNGSYTVEVHFDENLDKAMFSSNWFTDPNMAVADLVKQLETPITYFEYQGQHSSIFSVDACGELQPLFGTYRNRIRSDIDKVAVVTINKSGWPKSSTIRELNDGERRYIVDQIYRKGKLHLDQISGKFVLDVEQPYEFLFPKDFSKRDSTRDFMNGICEDARITLNH